MQRTRAIVAAIVLALSLAPAATFSQTDPDAQPDPATDPGAEVQPAQDDAPDPYGICYDGECSLPQVTQDDLDLIGDPDVIYTDEQDPPAPVICFEGQTTCLLNEAGLTMEDLRIVSGGRVIHGAVDGDPTGGWQVENLRGKMTCRHPRIGRFTEQVKKTSAAGVIQRREDGRLVAEGLGDDDASVVLARLGPGVYASVIRLEEQGTKVAIHFFLGMTTADQILGTLVAESTARVQGARVTCKITRNFDMTRTSGPDEPQPSGAPEASGDPGMEFTEEEVTGEGDPDAMDFTEEEVSGEADPGAMDFTEDEVADDQPG